MSLHKNIKGVYHGLFKTLEEAAAHKKYVESLPSGEGRAKTRVSDQLELERIMRKYAQVAGAHST